NVFYIRWEDKAFAGIFAVFSNVFCTCIKYSFHKAVAVVEEVSASFYQSLDQVVMFDKCLIYQLAETIFVISQHLCSLFKCQTLRAVAAVIRNMTGSLVRQQFDLNIIVYCILQKVYNISMVRNRNGFFLIHVFLRNSEGFRGIFNYQAYPSLVMACLD